jgi:hypothetical protein
MGMDIYGLNPTLTEERPEIEYEGSTEEERKIYWNKLEAWEEANPGYYFRANVWSWRPINKIINLLNAKHDLDLDTEGFGSNSGNGLKTQQECDLLANVMEDYIEDNQSLNDSQTMYVNLGMWVADDNTFTIKEHQENKLNRDYPVGSILYSSVITDEGNLVRPAWGTNVEHFKEFVRFLRNCGGFEIW